MLCSEGSIVNHGIDCARAVTLKCRAWTCDLCHDDRRRQLVALAKAGQPTTFITLTSNPSRPGTPASRARGLADAWRTIVKRACRKYHYKGFAYFCVLEATKKGEPHLHILARVKWIDQRWLSRQMRELTGAPIVDIRMVKSAGEIAAYVGKYVGKAPHRFETCKRYWTTRSWNLVKPDPLELAGDWFDSWKVCKRSLAYLREDWEGRGWEVALEAGQLVGRREARLYSLSKALQ